MRVLAETDRLFITEMTMDMAMDVHKNSLDEDTRRFVPDEVFETLEDARETLEFLISRYGSMDGPLVYALITKNEERNIGYVQLVPVGDGKWEIGYHVAEAFTGKGYATACLNYARGLAVDADCYKMMLLTGSKSESTLKFYSNAGYNSTDKTAFIQWL